MRLPQIRDLGIVTACVLLLAGCLGVDATIEVNDDGTGTMSLEAGVDTEQLDMFEMASKVCAELGTIGSNDGSLPEGVTAEPIDDDDRCGVRATADFDDPGEVGELFERLNEPSASGAESELGTPFRGVTLDESDGEWEFRVAETNMADYEIEGNDTPAIMEQLVLDDFTVSITVDLPGRIVDHNADRTDGGTAVWELRVGDERAELFATAAADGGDSSGIDSTLLWVVLGVAAVIAGLTLWGIARRRSSRRSTGDEDTSHGPPSAPSAGPDTTPAPGETPNPPVGPGPTTPQPAPPNAPQPPNLPPPTAPPSTPPPSDGPSTDGGPPPTPRPAPPRPGTTPPPPPTGPGGTPPPPPL